MLKRLFVVASALLLVGCSQTYEVSVHNKTSAAITLWLTKEGGSAEEGWLAPEQLIEKKNLDRRYDMANVLPGDTGYTGKVSGSFGSGSRAVLRVYHGNFDLRDILKSKPQHTDYTLKAGENTLDALQQGTTMTIQPAAAASATGTK